MSNGTDGGAAGGSGVGAGTAQAGALSSLESTLNEIEQIINILNAIDGFTSRSVVCEIDNVCGQTLTYNSNSMNHGGLSHALPPQSIANQGAGSFGAGSSGVAVGVEGYVTYNVDDGRGSRFIVHFDNPELGGNSADCSVISPISNRYFTNAIAGGGNTNALMRFIIGNLVPPFSLKVFLNNTKPAGFNPSAPMTSIRSLQPPVTSIRAFMRV
jgi:hypothetical protein